MVEGLPSSNKCWKKKFFFVFGEGWEFNHGIRRMSLGGVA